MPITVRVAVLAAIVLAFPAAAFAGTSAGQPTPTNLDTVADASQLTGLRVDLPQPNCAANALRCDDVAVLNTLDGFNIQPRLTIPFSGPIDLSTVSSSTIFLIGPGGHVVGIDQSVWEPLTNTLHAETAEQLDQDSMYLLVVTRGVHDTAGQELDTTTFRRDLNFGQTKDPAKKAYRKALIDALNSAFVAGVHNEDIAAASLFTTQSITAISEKIRDQIRSAPAPQANFNIATGGARAVFANAATLQIRLNRQNSVAGPLTSSTLNPGALFLPTNFPGSVGTIAYGSFPSPNYEDASQAYPPVGTRTGVPAVQRNETLVFTLFVPSGTAPAGGWPVAIFGHGFTDSMNGAPWAVGASLAHAGIAMVAINVVGHGGGAAGTFTISRPGQPTLTIPDGGRGIDQDHNGTIDSTEGVNAANGSIVSNRDGLRQTVIDLVQLTHVLQGGVDVDGDGTSDLSRSRIYYSGQSFGGIYGVELLGLESTIRAGVPNVAGGPIIEIARLSPSFRGLVGLSLLARGLYNATPVNGINFDENMPLKGQPLVVDTVNGAEAIQDFLDESEWAQQAGNPEGWAPYISMPVIYQFARGDKTVPNPTASRVIHAGHLESRTTIFRNDLTNPLFGTSSNPHTFLTNILGPGQPFAYQAQNQIATFFASDGATTIDPDGAAPYFETPSTLFPEDLAFIP
jgi:Bacterial Ig-like domain